MYACPRNLCFAGFDVFFLGRIALAGRFPWHGLIQSLAMFFLTWNTKLDFPLKWKRSCARSQTPGSLAHTGFPRRVSVASWEVVVLQTGKTNTSTIMIHHHPSSVRDAQKPIKRGPILWAPFRQCSENLKKTYCRHPGIHTEVWNTVFVLRIILGFRWPPGCRVSGVCPLKIQSPDFSQDLQGSLERTESCFPQKKTCSHLPENHRFLSST